MDPRYQTMPGDMMPLHYNKPAPLRGYLKKQGDTPLSGWKKRYFAQVEEKLHYFVSQKDMATGAKGFIDLLAVSAVRQPEPIKYPNRFDLVTKDRIYKLETYEESDKSATQWIQAVAEWVEYIDFRRKRQQSRMNALSSNDPSVMTSLMTASLPPMRPMTRDSVAPGDQVSVNSAMAPVYSAPQPIAAVSEAPLRARTLDELLSSSLSSSASGNPTSPISQVAIKESTTAATQPEPQPPMPSPRQPSAETQAPAAVVVPASNQASPAQAPVSFVAAVAPVVPQEPVAAAQPKEPAQTTTPEQEPAGHVRRPSITGPVPAPSASRTRGVSQSSTMPAAEAPTRTIRSPSVTSPSADLAARAQTLSGPFNFPAITSKIDPPALNPEPPSSPQPPASPRMAQTEPVMASLSNTTATITLQATTVAPAPTLPAEGVSTKPPVPEFMEPAIQASATIGAAISGQQIISASLTAAVAPTPVNAPVVAPVPVASAPVPAPTPEPTPAPASIPALTPSSNPSASSGPAASPQAPAAKPKPKPVEEMSQKELHDLYDQLLKEIDMEEDVLTETFRKREQLEEQLAAEERREEEMFKQQQKRLEQEITDAASDIEQYVARVAQLDKELRDKELECDEENWKLYLMKEKQLEQQIYEAAMQKQLDEFRQELNAREANISQIKTNMDIDRISRPPKKSWPDHARQLLDDLKKIWAEKGEMQHRIEALERRAQLTQIELDASAKAKLEILTVLERELEATRDAYQKLEEYLIAREGIDEKLLDEMNDMKERYFHALIVGIKLEGEVTGAWTMRDDVDATHLLHKAVIKGVDWRAWRGWMKRELCQSDRAYGYDPLYQFISRLPSHMIRPNKLEIGPKAPGVVPTPERQPAQQAAAEPQSPVPASSTQYQKPSKPKVVKRRIGQIAHIEDAPPAGK